LLRAGSELAGALLRRFAPGDAVLPGDLELTDLRGALRDGGAILMLVPHAQFRGIDARTLNKDIIDACGLWQT
jgi:hypothetical protein